MGVNLMIEREECINEVDEHDVGYERNYLEFLKLLHVAPSYRFEPITSYLTSINPSFDVTEHRNHKLQNKNLRQTPVPPRFCKLLFRYNY